MGKIKKNMPKYIFFIGVIFIFIGSYRGEIDVVFRKAITICLECIGIG